MKLFILKFICFTLIALNIQNTIGSEENTIDGVTTTSSDQKTFYILFLAKDTYGNTALFAPSVHAFPLNDLPEWYRTQIYSKEIALVEHEGNRELWEKSASKEFLTPEAFIEDNPWSFPYHHEEYQKVFSKIAALLKDKGLDYSYLKDISVVKPGLLGYLSALVFNDQSYMNQTSTGMDQEIEELFLSTPGKQVRFLENPQEVMNCFALYTAKLNNVDDELDLHCLKRYSAFLENPKEAKEQFANEEEIHPFKFYCNKNPTTFREAIKTLEEMMKEEYEFSGDTSLLLFDGCIGKRNRVWMPKSFPHIKNNNAVFILGCFHFFGPEGLLSLGQEAGLTWQYYNELGEWEDFRYPLD